MHVHPDRGFSGTDGFDYDVSDGRNGHDGAHVTVTVPAPVASERPVAAFRTVPLGGFAPLSVSFDGSGSTDPDGEVVAWSWDFGDGEQGSGRVAGHTYESAGSSPVKLTVTDSDGAKDSVQFDYQVQSQATLGVPMCGDEDDGTISFGCPEFDLVRDVQLFQVRGSGQVQVEFDFIFREAAFDNELAVVPVDDHAGAIGDLKPGDDGYIRKALERAQVVFPTGSTAFTPDKTLTFEGGQLLMFMIVQGQSVATLLAVNPDNDPSGFVIGFFTLDAINPDVADHVFAFRHESDGRTEFGWEDLAGGGGDFNDIVYIGRRARPGAERARRDRRGGRAGVCGRHAERLLGRDRELRARAHGDPVRGADAAARLRVRVGLDHGRHGERAFHRWSKTDLERTVHG